MAMDRRDFLKLFAITAAGIYVPTKSYFFMPKRDVQIYTEASYRGIDFLMYEPIGVDKSFNSGGITLEMIRNLERELRQNYAVPKHLIGSKDWIGKIENGQT